MRPAGPPQPTRSKAGDVTDIRSSRSWAQEHLRSRARRLTARAAPVADHTGPPRDRYGKSNFGDGCLLARPLVEHGVRSVEVDHGGWTRTSTIPKRAKAYCPPLDNAPSALPADCESRACWRAALSSWRPSSARRRSTRSAAAATTRSPAPASWPAGACARAGLRRGPLERPRRQQAPRHRARLQRHHRPRDGPAADRAIASAPARRSSQSPARTRSRKSAPILPRFGWPLGERSPSSRQRSWKWAHAAR